MAFIPAAIAAVGAALGPSLLGGIAAAGSIAAGAVGFIGAQQSAKQQKQAYEQQAAFQTQLSERNAALVDIEGEAAQLALKRDRQRRLASLTAAMSASGAQLAGSPLDLYADNAAQASRDMYALRYNTNLRRQEALLGGAIATRKELLGSIGADIQSFQSYGSILGGFGQALQIGAGFS